MSESAATFKCAIARLRIGLLQGLLLYFLYESVMAGTWPATNVFLFSPLLMVCLFAPVLLISSLGHLQKKQMWIWILVAITIIGLLAFYDVWRNGDQHNFYFNVSNSNTHTRFPSALLCVFTFIVFYIAHSLVLASAIDNQRIAKYSTYFETAWKLLIQIKFSAMFVAILWAVLWLGAALFMLVGLDFLKVLLQKPWFIMPATAFAFSCAMHITDVRPAIIHGIRSLILVLMSWILPITTLLVAGFLVSLPLTGLTLLWATRNATSVLMGSATVLIIMINAAYQNGEMASNVAKIVRISAKIAALMLLPITAIAVYSLSLRINEYGWTTDRIIATACLVVISCYALGYAWAACQETSWLGRISTINVANAFVILIVLIALFSPIADPARLSVNNQIARLESGKINPSKFDFDYLKFEGARYGLAALGKLKLWSKGSDADLVRKKADAALRKENKWQREEMKPPVDLAANLTVWPQTAHLPTSFLTENWEDKQRNAAAPRCLKEAKHKCDAYLIDVNDDGKSEVLLINSERWPDATLLMAGKDGHWGVISNLPYDFAKCTSLHKKLKEGHFKIVPSLGKDLEIAGQRIEIRTNTNRITNCGN